MCLVKGVVICLVKGSYMSGKGPGGCMSGRMII